jgi:molecular chaperone DnaK (HSP70)
LKYKKADPHAAPPSGDRLLHSKSRVDLQVKELFGIGEEDTLKAGKSASTSFDDHYQAPQSLSAEVIKRLREDAHQKEAELKEIEDESIATLNDAFDVLQRFSDVIEADDFIEDSRRRIDQARPDERTRTILDVLRSTSKLIDVVDLKRWRQ